MMLLSRSEIDEVSVLLTVFHIVNGMTDDASCMHGRVNGPFYHARQFQASLTELHHPVYVTTHGVFIVFSADRSLQKNAFFLYN